MCGLFCFISCSSHAGIVNPRKSLFTYGPNGDWDSFHDINYVPAFEPTFSSTELEEQANEVCGDDQLCLFDIAATGNVDIGSSTVQSVQEQELLKALFVPSNFVNYLWWVQSTRAVAMVCSGGCRAHVTCVPMATTV